MKPPKKPVIPQSGKKNLQDTMRWDGDALVYRNPNEKGKPDAGRAITGKEMMDEGNYQMPPGYFNEDERKDVKVKLPKGRVKTTKLAKGGKVGKKK